MTVIGAHLAEFYNRRSIYDLSDLENAFRRKSLPVRARVLKESDFISAWIYVFALKSRYLDSDDLDHAAKAMGECIVKLLHTVPNSHTSRMACLHSVLVSQFGELLDLSTEELEEISTYA